MSLMDTLFYWLQMKWVSSAHPEDEAAKETLRFFAQMLLEDHGLNSFEVDSIQSGKVHVTYSKSDGTSRTVWFDQEAVEQLNRDMFGQPNEMQCIAEDEEGTV